MSIFGSPATDFSQSFNNASPNSNAINTSVGDLIIVCALGQGIAISPAACTDSAGNGTYTALTAYYDATTSAVVQWFYIVATAASASNVITVNYSSNHPSLAGLAVWDVPCTGAPSFDVSTALGDNTASP